MKAPDIVGLMSADIRNDTLTGGGLGGSDLSSAAVGSSEVVDDSLSVHEMTGQPRPGPSGDARRTRKVGDQSPPLLRGQRVRDLRLAEK